jgi:chromosome segregation ATPase
MTEQPKKEEKQAPTVSIDITRNAEIEALQAELRKIEEEARGHKAEAVKLAAEKATLEEEKNNALSEKEQLEASLTQIAEKEFQAKSLVILGRAESAFGNKEDKRYKEFEARLKDPEHGPQNLKELEFTMGVLEDALTKGKTEMDDFKKKEEEKQKVAAPAQAPTGGNTAPLNSEQVTGGAPKTEEGYDSYEAMITDLVVRAKDSKDPAKQAEAQAVLQEFWIKWAKQVHKDFEQHTKISQMRDYESTEKKHHGVE